MPRLLLRADIQKHFDEVRRGFFDGWDAERRWKIEFGSHPGDPTATGYCDSKSKTIFLNDIVLKMNTPWLRVSNPRDLSRCRARWP